MDYKKTIRSIIYSVNYPGDWIFCMVKLGYWHPSWRLFGFPLVSKNRRAKIIFGQNLILCSSPKKNTIGVFQKVIIKAPLVNAVIRIGNNVGISGATISGRDITIGNNVLIGSGVLITDSDAHSIHPDLRLDNRYIKRAPVIIEDDVFIGARSIILKGVTIGRGTVIGAGSVVVKDIPPMCIAAGNPAKVIRKIEENPHRTTSTT